MNRRRINDEELAILFNLIGQGIWYLQYMEDALHTFITLKVDIKKIGSVNEKEGEKYLSKRRSNTLGVSLKVAKENHILSKELETRLELFLGERNWLVHRSVNQNGDDLYLDFTRNKLIARIEEFVSEAQILHKVFGKEIEKFTTSQGLSQKWVEETAKNEIAQLRGKMPNKNFHLTVKSVTFFAKQKNSPLFTSSDAGVRHQHLI